MSDLLVCKDGEIADGGVRVVRSGDIEIGVIHQGGNFYAYRNLCPHQRGPACEGIRMPQVIDVIGKDGVFLGQKFSETDLHIVCPWHGYEFHLADGTNVCNGRLRLQKFSVAKRDGEVYVTV